MGANPFKPTAGKNPPIIIGRDEVIEEFAEGLENGPGAPGRLMRVSGMRGMGKTVLLNEIGSYARALGWTVLDETASEGFCDRLLAAANPDRRVGRITAGPSILGVSLGTVELDRATLSLREALGALAKRDNSGVLITLDEVQDASLDEMRALSVAIQHIIREDRNIAFVFAGLPSMIENVVNGRTLTFLRRAAPVEVGPVDIEEVAQSFARTMAETGMAIAQEVCEELAESTQGYPFMVQLVGYYVWQAARKAGTDTVDKQQAQEGTLRARRRFDATVIEPVLQRLPGTAISYLLAMASDGAKPSESGEVARRLGKTLQQVSTVRARLMREDVIESRSWGRVSFAIPHMADYLNEHRDELEAEIASL